jgi:predicted phosphodiesterase
MARQLTRVIGDCHGKYRRFKNIIRNASRSICVGDMGVGFRYYDAGRELRHAANPPHDAMVKRNCRYIRGNHDNPNVCRNQSQWIPDGTVENDVMYIGGALSIDIHLRTEGLSWWADEECSLAQLNHFVDVYDMVRPRVMICHECPESIADTIMKGHNKNKILRPSRTRQALQGMLEIHRPEIFLFGHWHVDIDQVIDGTRFICLNELSYIDLEL